jgi:hypothetical protein
VDGDERVGHFARGFCAATFDTPENHKLPVKKAINAR